MSVTYLEARKAYLAIRQIDSNQQGGIHAFSGNVRAKFCALRLINTLKDVYEAGQQTLQELIAEYSDEKGQPKNVPAYQKREREEMRKVVDGLDPSEVAIKASVIGSDSLKKIPTDLLAELGQFFVWDIPEDGAGFEDGAKNREERRQ